MLFYEKCFVWRWGVLCDWMEVDQCVMGLVYWIGMFICVCGSVFLSCVCVFMVFWNVVKCRVLMFRCLQYFVDMGVVGRLFIVWCMLLIDICEMIILLWFLFIMLCLLMICVMVEDVVFVVLVCVLLESILNDCDLICIVGVFVYCVSFCVFRCLFIVRLVVWYVEVIESSVVSVMVFIRVVLIMLNGF